MQRTLSLIKLILLFVPSLVAVALMIVSTIVYVLSKLLSEVTTKFINYYSVLLTTFGSNKKFQYTQFKKGEEVEIHEKVNFDLDKKEVYRGVYVFEKVIKRTHYSSKPTLVIINNTTRNVSYRLPLSVVSKKLK